MLKCDFCGLHRYILVSVSLSLLRLTLIGTHSHLPCAGYPDQNDERIPSKFKCADCRSDEPLDLRQMRMKALARRLVDYGTFHGFCNPV